MKILALISDAYGGHGGIAKFNRDLLGALCVYSDTHEVIAVPRVMPNEPGELPNKLTYVTNGLGSKRKYLLTGLNQMILKKKKYDLIVCGHINLLPFAYLAKKLTKSPILLIIHGIDAWEPINKKTIKLSMKYVDHVVSVSELTLNRFLKWSKLNDIERYVLPNSFEPGIFTPGETNPTLIKRYNLENKKVIMTLGRLAGKERYKGFDETIEALPDLIKEIPNLVYMIVGDGIDQCRLSDKVESLGLNEHVVFTGLVSEEEKVDHYRLADAFVMPSRGEGFGIVLLEAMACGIPVLASKMDGSSEALKHGELGLIVDPTNSKEVIDGIKTVLSREKGKVPDNINYFSYENYVIRVHRILEHVRGVKTS